MIHILGIKFLDLHLRWKGEEDGNPGLVSRNTEWLSCSEGVGVWRVLYYRPHTLRRAMARMDKPVKIAKAVRALTYFAKNGVNYLDIMKDLSTVNRRLYPQGMCVGIESIEFYFAFPVSGAGALDTVVVSANTAGDSWSVHNAHVKGEALWHEMNELVLEDNPSIQGKWADYKVFLDGAHRGSVYSGVGNLVPLDGGGVPFLQGS